MEVSFAEATDFWRSSFTASHVGNKEKGGSAHGKGSATAEW